MAGLAASGRQGQVRGAGGNQPAAPTVCGRGGEPAGAGAPHAAQAERGGERRMGRAASVGGAEGPCGLAEEGAEDPEWPAGGGGAGKEGRQRRWWRATTMRREFWRRMGNFSNEGEEREKECWRLRARKTAPQISAPTSAPGQATPRSAPRPMAPNHVPRRCPISKPGWQLGAMAHGADPQGPKLQ